MKKNIFIAFVGLVFIGCQPKTKPENSNNLVAKEEAKSASSPDTTVALTFINNYVANCNKMAKAEGMLRFVDSNTLITKSFKTELKKIVEEAEKKEPEMGLDFDPIFNAQDFPEEGFTIISLNNETGFLVVEGKKWKDFQLSMKLVNENNKWLVDGCGVINIPKEKRVNR